jgi:hypothetical protein
MDVLWCVWWTSLCLKSEVWAAWWQGMGTVLAICVAIGIAAWQGYAERHRRRLDEQDRDNRAIRVSTYFGLRLFNVLSALADALRNGEASAVHLHTAALNDLLRWVDVIPLERLSGDVVEAFLRIREIAAGAISYARDADRPEADYEALEPWLGGLALRVKAHLGRMGVENVELAARAYASP